ncbi:hypothetical protein ACIPW5_06450 [Streptomyces sp. NPDC090077]|uniref:hypothetical protein n=1 Tax=Streptomyces sp. NPDC090077 TaxID=3365938 RepID=UPI0037FB3A9C
MLASATVALLIAAVPANAVATAVDGHTRTVAHGTDGFEGAERANSLWFGDDEIVEYDLVTQQLLVR